MEKKTTQVAIQGPTQPTQVDTFIQKAIEMNAAPETLERLFALHKEVKAEFARTEFTKALSQFQQACPEIKKNKKVLNKDGTTIRYQYATLDSIGAQIQKALTDNGLSYSWDVTKKENNMEVTVTITHILGHKETSTLEIPISSDGYMSEPQKYASAQTYAKRYTLINALGITTADEDTDATDIPTKPARNAKSPKAKIVLALKRLGYSTDDIVVIKEKVLHHTQLELVEDNYDEIVSRLETVIKEREEYEKENAGA